MAVRANRGQSPDSVSMLDQRRIRLTGIEPAMDWDADPRLSRYCVGRPTLCVPGTSYRRVHWLISNGGGKNIDPHIEDILVSLVLSIIISCAFRILAHKEHQYSYIYKILGNFFCQKHSNRLKPGLRVRELLFQLLINLLSSLMSWYILTTKQGAVP